MNVIPAIDLRGGRCVRLYQGEFDRETEYSSDPVAVADRFAGLGVAHLHIVDLDGARSGTQQNQEIVNAIAQRSSLSIQLGGGIRDYDNVAQWLEAGVDRCVVGSMAVTDAATVKDWLGQFGANRIVLALDVRIDESGTPRLSTHGWERLSDLSLWDCVDDYLASGLQHVLCTDVSRDGALSGPNIALYEKFTRRFDTVALQASGGVRDLDDLHALRDAGAAAAITGRALLDGKLGEAEIRSFLPDA